MTIIDCTYSLCNYVQLDALTSGTTVFKATIRTDSAWDGLTKTAVWSNGTTTIDVLESSWTDGVCTIPHEVLTAGSYVSVGLYGVDGTGAEVLRTQMFQLGNQPVRAGADPSGDESVTPTPTTEDRLASAEAAITALMGV